MGQILTIVASLLAIGIGLYKHYNRIAGEKRKLAEQAKKDLEKANETGNPSDFLDGFGRLR